MDIKISRILKNINKPGTFLELLFTDAFGEEAQRLMPRKLIENTAKIKDWLLDNNFPQQDKPGWEIVCQKLQAKEPTNQFGLIVNKMGFWDKGYLLPNGNFIGSQEDHTLLLESELAKYLPNCGVSGTLKEWKKNIAPAALHSSRIMLAICGGPLSGYLLKITGVENGGFHFEGRSSIGKTTLLKCATSISGPTINIQTWNFTDAALQEIAFARNDSHISFDEIKTAHHDPKIAAKMTTSAIYKLSSGVGKATSNNYSNEQLIWRIAILSTGEDSLAAHAMLGGVKRKEGEEVRMIDVPADAGKEMGIFESIPEDFEDASTYAQYLGTQSQLFYGTPQAAFLEKLIADLNAENPESSTKDQLIKWMESFREKCDIDTKSGTEVRFANRFALAYAAGCLAVEYKVLPFTVEDVFNGISECYKATLAMQPESWKEKVKQHLKKLANHLNSKDFIALDAKESWSKKEIEENDGFNVSINNISLIALKRDVVRNLIPPLYLKDVIDFCKSKGNLLIDAKGNNTRSITLNGKKVRFYCFVLPGDKKSRIAVKRRNQGYAAKKNSE
jgi:hypothetical protein